MKTNRIDAVFNNKTSQYEVRKGGTKILFHSASLAKVQDYCRASCLSINKHHKVVYHPPTIPTSAEETIFEKCLENSGGLD